MTFLTLLAVAAVLTFIAFSYRQILLSLAASLGWLAAGIWMLLSPDTTLPIGDPWSQAFGFALILMTIAPVLQYIMRLGKTEITTTDAKTGKVYRMWEKPPKAKVVSRSQSSYDAHRARLRMIRDRSTATRR